MTLDQNLDTTSKVTFWESLTGQKLQLSDPRIHRFYRTIGCVFNQTSFYANIQPDDWVISTIFELEDDALWKSMDKQQIKSLPPVPQANLMNPDIDSFDLEAQLEKELKKKFE